MSELSPVDPTPDPAATASPAGRVPESEASEVTSQTYSQTEATTGASEGSRTPGLTEMMSEADHVAADAYDAAPEDDNDKDHAYATPSEAAQSEAITSAERPLYLPWGLRMAAAWIACIVVIGGGSLLILRATSPILGVVVIPVFASLLLGALLRPAHRRLDRVMPSMLAAVMVVVGALVAVVGIFALVGSQAAAQMGDLADQAIVGYERFLAWLESGPFGLDPGRLPELLDGAVSQATGLFRGNPGSIIGGTLSVATTAGGVLVGLVLALFITLFILADGERMAQGLVQLLPAIARPRAWGAAVSAWHTLGLYARAQVLVAVVDSIGIGLGAALLGIPLAVPLALLVFLGSFVPLVGALVTGMVAVLVALVAKGATSALLMVAVVLLVQQIEGNVLQPLVMGRAVALHPVAVLLAVTAGSAVLGIFGAFIAVPVVAVANRVGLYLAGMDPTAAERDESQPGFVDRLSARLHRRRTVVL